MSSAHIVANQAGKPAGQSSVSRRDLDLAVVVYLSNASDDGVRSHRWRMVDRPSGSLAVITNKASAVAQFTPDVPGSYLVELEVDEARDGQVDRRVFAVLTDFGGATSRPLRIPAAGEDDEANWLYDFGVTATPNTRGWMPDFVELLLYTGLLGGADTLAAVLLAGNTTSGSDIVVSAGDAVRGAPGAGLMLTDGAGLGSIILSVTGDVDEAGADLSRTASGSIEDTAPSYKLNASGGATLSTPEVILSTAAALLRGTDGATPTGFTVRGGDGSGGNTAGAGLTLRGGVSVGTGVGSDLNLSPGEVATGARGAVILSHTGPDTDRLTDRRTSGTNGATVSDFTGTRNPSGLITASCGDVYRRDSGSLGEVYVKSAGNASSASWHKLGNTTLFSRDNVAQTVSGTTTETTIVDHTVLGGSMGANGTLRVHAQGLISATAVGTKYTFRIKFGGTTIFAAQTATVGPAAGSLAWCMDVTLVNANNAAVQTGGGRFDISDVSNATTGVGILSSAGGVGGAISLAAGAKDTTSDQHFTLTVEHTSNSASTSTTRSSTQAVISLH